MLLIFQFIRNLISQWNEEFLFYFFRFDSRVCRVLFKWTNVRSIHTAKLEYNMYLPCSTLFIQVWYVLHVITCTHTHTHTDASIHGQANSFTTTGNSFVCIIISVLRFVLSGTSSFFPPIIVSMEQATRIGPTDHKIIQYGNTRAHRRRNTNISFEPCGCKGARRWSRSTIIFLAIQCVRRLWSFFSSEAGWGGGRILHWGWTQLCVCLYIYSSRALKNQFQLRWTH